MGTTYKPTILPILVLLALAIPLAEPALAQQSDPGWRSGVREYEYSFRACDSGWCIRAKGLVAVEVRNYGSRAFEIKFYFSQLNCYSEGAPPKEATSWLRTFCFALQEREWKRVIGELPQFIPPSVKNVRGLRREQALHLHDPRQEGCRLLPRR